MVKKETGLEKIERLCTAQKNIRNLATSAHIHHGKCIAPDSRIMLTNGSIKTAKELYEGIAEDGKIFQENEEHTIFAPSKPIEIFSLNKKTGKIEKKNISFGWRLAGGKTIKIKLRNGFDIETTPEHKYIAFRDGFEDVEAKDIKLGDRIICARKLEVNENSNTKTAFLERISHQNFYIYLEEQFFKELKAKILEFGIKNIKTSIKSKSFYHGLWQNRINLKDFIEICSLFKINLEEAYDKIEHIFYRTGKQRGHNSLTLKLPINFEAFFYLAGLFFGDGSGKKFIVGKEELGNKFSNICQDLGFNPIRVERKDRTPELHTNFTLIKMFESLFDYPKLKKSHNIKMSDFIMKAPKKLVACFLRGYFDTDGCVEKSRSAVTISSASSQMINDLHLLLLRFGIVAIKEKDNTLTISGNSALNFQANVGFGSGYKCEKLNTLVENANGSMVCDTIKLGSKVMLLNKINNAVFEDLAFIEVKSIEESYQDVVYDFTIPETHNFIAEGMVIHNTALTDNLLAASGYMASKNAGDLEEGMATWQHGDEQERLMTVDSANVSMVHEFGGEEYLINLIDTPGHVDFGGNVTRAMRAIDGTIVLVCASEGIMPQTETVIKQALKERVKPVLFINKMDRLIKELKLTPEGIQQRLLKIIGDFNILISQIADPEFRKIWQVDVNDGSVAFGSARDNWALSIPFMKKKGVSFKDVLNIYSMEENERKDWCWKNAPLFEVLLDMVIKHLPSPLDAQKYRIPKIWHGDIETQFGKDLINCNPQGKVGFVITRIVIDPRSGKEVCAGRLFSGTIKNGMEVYLNLAKSKQRVQQVLIYNGIKPEQMEELPCGNVLAIAGILGEAGETVTEGPETPFEEMKHIFEPVITKSISVPKPQDLPKLIDVLKKVAKEDPSIRVQINEETGENLISGMGELHLEIIENRIKTEKGVAVITSPPIVVYRETVDKVGEVGEGKSPNKHNLFFLKVEPLELGVYQAMKNGEINNGRIKKKDEPLWKKLNELGISNEEARQYIDIYKNNVFLNKIKGEVNIGEVIELVLDAFEQVVDAGPISREPCIKMKVSLVDIKLHEDAIHRGPAQVYPAVRDAVRAAMATAKPVLYEPLQMTLFECPLSFMGAVTKLIQSKRGQLVDVQQTSIDCAIKAKMPVSEMIGLASDLRSETEGRGNFSMIDQSFEKMPASIQEQVVRQIRNRKGLADNE